MKRILFIAFAIVMVSACQPKRYGAFVVTGTIQNAPGKKLVLMETPYASEQPVVLDSTVLNNKGDFTLRGRANEEGVYRLLLENGPDVIIINDNNSIHLNLDVNNYRNYTIEGSPASEKLHTLFEDYRKIDSTILTGFKKIDSLRTIPGKDSLAEAWKTENDQRVVALNNLLKNFIATSTSPAASLYVLGIASQTVPTQELKALVDATANKFPTNSALARVKSIMAMKKTPPTQPAAITYKLLDQQAPNLTMNDPAGKPVSISNFRGKYLLVDFWASWCGPCRAENQNVVAAYNKFKDRNFTILGVSLDQDKSSWEKAIAKDNLTWNHMSDLKYWESAAVQAYQFEGIPFNVLIDPTGKIIASGLTGEALENKLEEVLK